MTDIIFSFDTEDFTSSRAADGILYEANLFREEGVKGCFCVVGLLAKHLKEWGRYDVIEALSHHEIGTHTYGHTLHPMINEYTDIEDFYEAQDELIRQESLGVEYIKQVLGVDKVYAACPPGNQKSYVAMYGYHKMGVPIYADTFCDTVDGEGSYYCNIYHVAYYEAMECFFNGDENDVKALLEKVAKRKRAVIYTHPNSAASIGCWDILNYDKENLVEFGKFLECPPQPREATERFYNNIRTMLRLVKADPRFRITTYEELTSELSREAERVVTIKDIPEIARKLNKSFENIRTPVSLCISDIALACRDLLLGKKEHKCGDVYGFLTAPYAIDEEITVSAEEIIEGAKQIEDDKMLPSCIMAGDKKIGPADWLFGALEVLQGKSEVVLTPRAQLPSLDIIPETRDAYFKGTWRHSDSFEDKYLSDRLRYQAWTLRFPNY
jgi:peptidoglycan/xylan/chitin deacetylase (PgdA/CDA1 family)